MQNPQTVLDRIVFVHAIAVWTDKDKMGPNDSTAWSLAFECGAHDGLDAVFSIHAGSGGVCSSFVARDSGVLGTTARGRMDRRRDAGFAPSVSGSDGFN